MHHFRYTVDIATISRLTREQQHALIMAFDELLENYPYEFEDWKVTTSEDERKV